MTYFIRQKDGRWLIYACGACILDCEDEAMAVATMAAARDSLQVTPRDNGSPVPFPSQRNRAEARKTAAAGK
jgi:hypothetical protein